MRIECLRIESKTRLTGIAKITKITEQKNTTPEENIVTLKIANNTFCYSFFPLNVSFYVSCICFVFHLLFYASNVQFLIKEIVHAA